MTKTNRQLIFSFIASLLAIIVIVSGVIVPTVRDIKRLGGIIKHERLSFEQYQLGGQLLEDSGNSAELTERHRKVVEEFFVQKGNEFDFIADLEATAAQHSVTQVITVTPPAATKPTSGYQPLSLRIEVNGSFARVMSYLEALDKLKYGFNTNELDIAATSGQETIQMIIAGEVYTKI